MLYIMVLFRTKYKEMLEKLLSLENVSFYRNHQWIIKKLNIELYRGEILTLIGPNGSGKTTTIKLALGIQKPTEGSIWRKPKIKIGYVPQKLAIDSSFPMSVIRLMKLNFSAQENEIFEVLKTAEILHLKNAQISSLSGGELQRVLLARSVLHKPDILVLDEPLQGVDYAGEQKLYKWIQELRKRLNCAILLISHDLHIVMAKTDRVICLDKGHICCSGLPNIVQESEIYNELFKKQSLAIYKHYHNDSSKK